MTAENGMTGIAIGSRNEIITHQRVEFSLLSIEQVINQVAKWYFMTGSKKCSIVIRLIIGRHSRKFRNNFCSNTGLKVYVYHPKYAKEFCICYRDPNQLLFLSIDGFMNWKAMFQKYYKTKLKENFKKREDITLVSSSYDYNVYSAKIKKIQLILKS